VDDLLLQRAVPAHDQLSAFFWASGANGVLSVLRCATCATFVHPPAVPCPSCLSTELRPAAVSGRATVLACTVNVQQWVADQPPYAIAIVELAEQQGLRLTSNIVGCAPDAVHIGQQVVVSFVHRNGLYYPVFVPASGD
jgi:uncharacterized protein